MSKRNHQSSKTILVMFLCLLVTGCFAKKLEVESMSELLLFSGSAVDGYSYDYIFAENIISKILKSIKF